jgi:hypothetical protein
MDQTETNTPSQAEQIMSAAGFRRERAGGNLECWRLDHAGGEFSLITADGDCDADPLAIVWTCGRYRNEGAGTACAEDPHHTSLARAIERVATLTVQDEAPTDVSAEAAAKADEPDKSGTFFASNSGFSDRG